MPQYNLSRNTTYLMVFFLVWTMFWYGLKGIIILYLYVPIYCTRKTNGHYITSFNINGGELSSEINMIYLRQLSLISPYHYCAVHCRIMLCCRNIVFGSSLWVRTCYYFIRHANETLWFLTDLLCLLIIIYTVSSDWRSGFTRVEHLLRDIRR